MTDTSTDDRAEFKRNRDHGLEKRQATRVAGRTQCHLTNDVGIRCTAEIADPLQHKGLCVKHLAELMAYVAQLQARIAERTKS